VQLATTTSAPITAPRFAIASSPTISWLSWRLYIRVHETLSVRPRSVPDLCERLFKPLLLRADSAITTTSVAAFATVPATCTQDLHDVARHEQWWC